MNPRVLRAFLDDTWPLILGVGALAWLHPAPVPLQPTGAVPWHALIARNDGFAELAGTFKKGSKQCVIEPGEGLPSLNGF